MSGNQRWALIGLAVVVLVVGFVLAKSGGDSNKDSSSSTSTATTPAATGNGNGGTAAKPAAPTVATVVVTNAKPVGGIKVLKFNKGGTIRFKVRSDTADEIHFHGYDKHQDVTKGGTVTFNVPATIDGKFVVELEQHKQQIASVEVAP
jgi:hypothetical protein